jgi:hypothetical protein
MARYKPAGARKPLSNKAADIRGALPCLFLVLAVIAILMLIFYLSLSSSTQ